MNKLEVLYQFEEFYHAMQPAQEKSSEVFSWCSGIPHPLFNAVMHLSCDQVRQKVDVLINKAPQNIPLAFWLHTQNRAPKLVEILKEKGFQRLVDCTLMTCSVKPLDLPKLDIRIADKKIFNNIIADVYQFNQKVQEGFITLMENQQIENYLIYFDNKPIGTGSLFIAHRAAGIFNIAILPNYQRQGHGKSMMQFLIKRAHEINKQKLILLSAKETEKFYVNLNFDKCLDIEIYARSDML